MESATPLSTGLTLPSTIQKRTVVGQRGRSKHETGVRKGFKEKDFQTIFNKWVRHNHTGSSAFELKVTPSAALPFDHVQTHQEAALSAAKHSKFIFKIPDAGWQNPFDSFILSGASAFIVVMFHSKERGQKEFVMIDIDAWLTERENSTRKSLTEERAKEIGLVRAL